MGDARASHPDAVVTRRRSTALMVAGIVMSTLGTAALGVAAGFIVAGERQQAECSQTSSPAWANGLCGLGGQTASAVGWGIAAGGATFVMHGVPMIVVGSWQVEAPRTQAIAGPRAKSVGLAWSF